MLGCELLIVKLATNGVAKSGANHMQIECILAETNVQFEAAHSGANAAKFKKMTCDRLVGEAANGAPLRLTGEGHVQFQASQGTLYGDQIEYSILEKKAKLTGNADVNNNALSKSGNARGKITFPVLWMDLESGIISTPKMKFETQSGSVTNNPVSSPVK
jgi:hypothetical protein